MDGSAEGLFHDPAEQRHYYETLIEASPTAIVMGDADFVVTLWNPGAERLFGYSSEEAIGAHLDDLVANHPDIHAEAVAWSAEAWEVDSFRRIGRRTRKDGTFVDVELLAVRVSHDTYYILYHDVTELERAPTAADPGRRAARRARPHP